MEVPPFSQAYDDGEIVNNFDNYTREELQLLYAWQTGFGSALEKERQAHKRNGDRLPRGADDWQGGDKTRILRVSNASLQNVMPAYLITEVAVATRTDDLEGERSGDLDGDLDSRDLLDTVGEDAAEVEVDEEMASCCDLEALCACCLE